MLADVQMYKNTNKSNVFVLLGVFKQKFWENQTSSLSHFFFFIRLSTNNLTKKKMKKNFFENSKRASEREWNCLRSEKCLQSHWTVYTKYTKHC